MLSKVKLQPKPKLRAILICALASVGMNLLVGCNNDVGNEENNLQTAQIQNASETHNVGCYDSFNETCGDSEIHLDGSTNEMHQKFKINPMYGNYMGDNIPMLISFKYNNRDWSMQHYHLGGNRNFDYNILESSLVFTDVNAESGCLSKPLIKQGETCYMYATAHLKIANENIKPDYNNFGGRYYNLYDDKDTGLGYMTVNMSTVQTVQSIREIMPFELQYYTEAIKNNMNQYQIIRLQNISYSESRILTIQPNGIKLRNSEDKTFALVTRTSAIDDEFYGTHTQCATPETAEPSNNQVSSLKRGEECLLIYKAADKSDKAGTITNILDLKTNATASPNMNPEMNGRGYTDPITPEFKLAAIYKPDGESKFESIEWKQTNVTSGGFNFIHHDNNIWVAGSREKGMYWSNDGMTWFQTNIKDTFISTYYYNNGLWIITSNIGPYWSKDGKVWNRYGVNYLGSIYYSNNIWVGYSSDGIVWSDDGNVWHKSNTPEYCSSVKDIQYANNTWVSVGECGILYSIDGKSWSKSNIVDTDFKNVRYANGIWLTNGSNYMRGVYWSVDGKQWNQSNLKYDLQEVPQYHNGVWVIMGSDITSKAFWSNDGKTWNPSNLNIFSYFNFANGIWIATNMKGAYWSADGKIWNPSNIDSALSCSYNNNNIWITSEWQINKLFWSIDGKVWNQSVTPNGNSWTWINYVNGTWVSASSVNSGIIYGIEHYSQPSGNLNNFVITH